MIRRSIFAALVFSTLAACGGNGDADLGPPPSDSLVYDASAQTKADLGIAKWGFSIDHTDAASVFHAYGVRNELVVEIRQTFDEPDVFTKHFILTMTGPAASGSERIDYAAQWNEGTQETTYVQTVVENTFAADTVAARILARLAPDAAAIPPTDGTDPRGSLVESVTPRDAPPGSSLVSTPSTLLVCCSDLTRESAGMSADAASSCPLVVAGDDPLASDEDVGTRALGGGGLDPQALVLGADGKPTIQSPWSGPYNIVDHHCHNAAAQNSSTTDGYIACTASSSTTTTQGHTINWAPDPSQSGGGSYCAYEPQLNGGSLIRGGVCCWQGKAGADGAPLFDSKGAQDCVNKLCLGQAAFGSSSPPKAFPAGSSPPLPNDCPSSTGTLVSCNSCCTTQGSTVLKLFGTGKDAASMKKQVQDYRKRCSAACTGRDLQRQKETQPQQGQSKAKQCLSSALTSKRSSTDASASCAKKP
jgi:hypothetical protein